METIKLTGNKFPVAESLHSEQVEQAEEIEPPLKEQDFTFPLKESLEESEDEKNEKRTLIRKIMRYRSTFPTELIDLSQKLNNLGCYSLYELRDLCRDVEYLVATRRISKAMRSFFLAGLGVLEVSGGIVGLQLNGLTHIASQNEELLSTVATSVCATNSVDNVGSFSFAFSAFFLSLLFCADFLALITLFS